MNWGLEPVGIQSFQLSQQLHNYLLEVSRGDRPLADPSLDRTSCVPQRVNNCCQSTTSSTIRHTNGTLTLKASSSIHQFSHLDVRFANLFLGYFHGFATEQPVDGVDPRSGSEMLKPPAPLHLRAFCVALREVNHGALQQIAESAPDGSNVRQLILEGKAFADIAFQIHHGAEVTASRVNWHTDASNSLIHLALGLHGDISTSDPALILSHLILLTHCSLLPPSIASPCCERR